MLVVFTGTFSFNFSNRIPNLIYRGMRVKVRNKILPWFSLPLIKSSAGFGPLDLNDIGELLKVFLFFNSPELKAQVSLPDRLSSVVRLSVRLSVNSPNFHLLFQNHLVNFNKLCTKHPWVQVIQSCSNEGPLPFPMGNTK